MPSPTVGTSHGYSITFPISTFTAEIVDVTPPESSVGDVETSHQGITDGWKTFSPELLIDGGEASLEIHFNPDKDPNTFVKVVEAAIVITHPSTATWTFPGYIKTYTPGGHTHLGKMMGTIVVKVAGKPTISAGTGG